MQNRYDHSVIPFFVLVFLLFIPFLVLGVIYPIALLPGLPISALGAFTPALAALILTYKQNHLSGVRQLLGRSFDFKHIKNNYWFLLILLVNPAVAVLAYGIMRVSGISLPNPTPLTLAVFPLLTGLTQASSEPQVNEVVDVSNLKRVRV